MPKKCKNGRPPAHIVRFLARFLTKKSGEFWPNAAHHKTRKQTKREKKRKKTRKLKTKSKRNANENWRLKTRAAKSLKTQKTQKTRKIAKKQSLEFALLQNIQSASAMTRKVNAKVRKCKTCRNEMKLKKTENSAKSCENGFWAQSKKVEKLERCRRVLRDVRSWQSAKIVFERKNWKLQITKNVKTKLQIASRFCRQMSRRHRHAAAEFAAACEVEEKYRIWVDSAQKRQTARSAVQAFFFETLA